MGAIRYLLGFGLIGGLICAVVLGGLLRAFTGEPRRLAEGDLAISTRAEFEGRDDVHRLLVSLRRAISQVQRVTVNLHRTSTSVSDEARILLEAARRQGLAVERSLNAVASMGESLGA